MINTIYGEMDESTLRKIEGSLEDDNEKTSWIEYWKDDELVHRSATVNMKQGFIGGVLTGQIGG
jgi:hypothetical protein